ncbi:MAG: glucose-6-phosphate dehydrogenase [Firmicutes bacterium]|nr:glucose-6-phosphate dehydrogenase [Bacillota bacterium]
MKDFQDMEPCILVIFGATGDLTQRKLYPALVNLARQELLPKPFVTVAVGRREKTDEEVRAEAKTAAGLAKHPSAKDRHTASFINNLHYFRMDFDKPFGYQKLRTYLNGLDEIYGTKGNRVFFLAVAPHYFGVIAHELHHHGMSKGNHGTWQRVVVEKPFGNDLISARRLNQELTEAFGERCIYRIDHYLGKEMLQNIMVVRFANTLFEPLWNSRYIEEVQITISEDVGVETRGGYYETAGALRDMVQNHMLQLLTLIAMEPPVALDADSVRDEKVKVLRSLRPLRPEDVGRQTIKGQYSSGHLNGRPVVGYREEDRVHPDSEVETYVALELYIDNFRWSGVPFYLRTGKRLPIRSAEIVIRFREQPGVLYFGKQPNSLGPNLLVVKIQPEEGIYLQFNAREPGTRSSITPVRMDYCQSCILGFNSPEAYERLLTDCIRGDSTLFTRWDEVEYAWSFVDNISLAWEQIGQQTELYPAGSWGPESADRMLSNNGHSWLFPFQCLLTERPVLERV